MPKPFVPIIMGSKSDLIENGEVNKKSNPAIVAKTLAVCGIDYDFRVCSAHKNSPYLIKMLEEYDSNTGLSIVYITIAGRSDGLSGTVAGHTTKPVIGCPPYSDKYGGSGPSTFYMPGKNPVAFIPDPENAALEAIRIFALSDEKLASDLKKYMSKIKKGIIDDDKEVRKLMV
jgi:phosphoribosylaminoimidazole carboxylase PurE protein